MRDLDPRFRELRPEVLGALPDDELPPAVYEHVLHHCLPDLARELEIVTGLPKAVQAIFTTTVLDNEVTNGGFNQFFWNSSGQYALLALEGLELLGATAHAAVVTKAIATYEAERAVLERFREDGSLEAFSESYKHTTLGRCDDEYYDLGFETLHEAQMRFVRNNLEGFRSGAPAV